MKLFSKFNVNIEHYLWVQQVGVISEEDTLLPPSSHGSASLHNINEHRFASPPNINEDNENITPSELSLVLPVSCRLGV